MAIQIIGLEKVFEKLQGLTNIEDLILSEVENSINNLKEQIKSTQLSGPPGIDIESGLVYNSFDSQIQLNEDALNVALVDDADYLVYHEYGTATIPDRVDITEAFQNWVDNEMMAILKRKVAEFLEK